MIKALEVCMYCSNCGDKLHKSHLFCPHCGAARALISASKHSLTLRPGRVGAPSVGRRVSVVLYAISYLALAALSVVVGLTIYQSFTTPDPQASYITCRNGTKVSYKLLGIRNPTTDAGHDNLLIDAACRDLGGNSYTNVMPRGQKDSAWKLGLAVFAGGLVVIEVVKGVLAYLINGHFPALGTLGRR